MLYSLLQSSIIIKFQLHKKCNAHQHKVQNHEEESEEKAYLNYFLRISGFLFDIFVATKCHRSESDRKHGFPPNYGKKQTVANATNSSTGDNQQTASTGEEDSSRSQCASISQEQYSQLINLLQQTNLLSQLPNSATNVNSTTNHISTYESTGCEITEDDWFG
ncbi:unnamed protein product [Vicia faba]|uniref:Uncharacterized protein n=1 Tax=Vicia faba TaxID=3906 RepID=A0AAV0YCY7_VICFA|nr:unnamed protein product [Vicia faba]